MNPLLRSTLSSIPRQIYIRHISTSTSVFSAEKNLAKRAATRLKPAAKEFISPIPKTSDLASDAASDAKATVSIAADVIKETFSKVTGNSTTNMSSSDEKVNASGLTPSESKNLPVRQPGADDKPILDAVKTLYECKPKNTTYDIFSDSAVFIDPLSHAEGLDRIKVQYNGLVALFPKAEVLKFDLLENPKHLSSSNTLLVNQIVDYYRSKEPDAEVTKKLNSLITITKGTDGKVIKLVEEWEHSGLYDSGNAGFLGMLNEGRKKAFAAACMPFISKEAPEDRK